METITKKTTPTSIRGRRETTNGYFVSTNEETTKQLAKLAREINENAHKKEMMLVLK
jgi:hypothetical protein